MEFYDGDMSDGGEYIGVDMASGPDTTAFHPSRMDRFIKILHKYESKDIKNMVSVFTEKEPPHPKIPSCLLLFDIGKKVWGEAFIQREYEMRIGQ